MAYLLLLGGVLLIALELFSPGLIGPGLFGAVALVLGLYGTAQLPLSLAGVMLLVLGIGFVVLETQVATGGVLGAAGALALAAGGLLVFDTGSDVLRVSVPMAVGVGIGFAALSLLASSKALALRTAPAQGDVTDLVGALGTVRAPLDPVGQVHVDGALWRARALEGDAPLPRGTPVDIARVDGLTLTVTPHNQGAPP